MISVVIVKLNVARTARKKTSGKKKNLTLKSTSFWQAASVGMEYMSSLHNPQDIQYSVRHSVRG